MPYLKGTATSLDNLLAQITAWVTDTNIHGTDAWTVKRSDPWPRGTIYEAKGLNGTNKSYIGLMRLDLIKGSTYKNWLLTNKNIGKNLIWHKKGINLDGAAFLYNDGELTFKVLTDKTNASGAYTLYTLSGVEIVNTSSNALVFGSFKQYNEGLDWNEQPGGIEVGELGQYPIYYKAATGILTKINPPIYPGLGYPGFGMATTDTIDRYFEFWITKDASNLTVVIQNGIQWDMGHAGMLKAYHSRMQYPHPAVVAGSNTGLRMVLSSSVKGNLVDYSYNNYSLSRSLPCTPCTDTTIIANTSSHVKVCLPDGKWQNFSNWTQTLATGSDTSGTWSYVTRPVTVGDSLGYQVRPISTDLTGVQDSLFNTTIAMEPFDLVQNDATSGSVGMLGSLHHMAWPGVDGPYGEVTVNSKKCLLIPNGWEDRLWYILNGKIGITDQDTLNTTYKEIIDYGKQFRMLIRLED